ncbi:MAG: hypothetical protein JWO99_163 [Candidatus Saccharibacteria bacterium]|nr:hypothetical protein [Candidatus Saccharibacteria bacterium]
MALYLSQKKLSLRHILIFSVTLAIIAVSVGFLVTMTKKDASALITPWQPGVLQIASNGTNKCLLTTDHAVYCWGQNSLGQLGDGTSVDRAVPQPVKDDNHVFDGKTITNLYSAATGYCALASGSLYCWGYNADGRLGNGVATSSSIPVAVDMTGVLAGKTITAFSSDDGATSCVIASGAPYCWGSNPDGQLGNGTTIDSLIPVAVDMTGVLAGKTITSLTTGPTPCVIASGAPYCWGSGYSFMLGDNGATLSSSVPMALDAFNVLTGKTVTSLMTFNGSFGCLIASGEVYCWGFEGGNGQLGTGSAGVSGQPLVPVNTSGVLSGKHIDELKIMQGYACVLSDGSLYCWGRSINASAVVDSLVPIQISGTLVGQHVDAFSLDYMSACAVVSGIVSCWGDNTQGQLGNNSTTSSPVPVAVDASGVLASKTVSYILAGSAGSPCVIASTHPYCWGSNGYGGVGNGTTIDALVPMALTQQTVEITNITPNSAYVGATPSFTVTGSGFIDTTAVVTIGGQVATTSGTDTMATGTVPVGSTPGPVDVTVTNSDGQTTILHNGFTYLTPPPQEITSATFTESAGKKILTIHGTGLFRPATLYSNALGRSLVSVDGVALPFCTEGTPYTAQNLIGFGVPAALVSDTPPCYYLIDTIGTPLIDSTTAVVRMPDTFDITTEGTVSVDSAPVYTFNLPDTGGSDGGTPQPGTGDGITSPVAPPPSMPVGATTDIPVTPIEIPLTVVVDDRAISDTPVISTMPTFTGFAPAGSKVTVVVHSDPVTCSTTADENGKWSCTLTEKLPVGSHSVYVTVATPENKTVELGPYAVTVSDEQPVTVTSDTATASTKQPDFPWLWVIIGGVLLVAVTIGIIGVNRRKRA